jgi:hypothetical protein
MVAQVEQLCNLTLLLSAPDLYQAGQDAIRQIQAGVNMNREYKHIDH